jgi:hypothetical protein
MIGSDHVFWPLPATEHRDRLRMVATHSQATWHARRVAI